MENSDSDMLAWYYNNIYQFLVILITVFVMSSYKNWHYENGLSYHNEKIGTLLLLMLFFTIAIGLRPISYAFVDMMNYHEIYESMWGTQFSPVTDSTNFIFDNIIPWFASNGIREEFFFLFIAAIYFGCMAWACIKLFPRDSLLAFVVFLGAFSTFSYATNGIKSGAAASIFLLALAYREKKLLAALFLFVSLGFHHSMLVPIVAFVIALFFRWPRVYLWGWIVAFVLAALHVTYFQTFFSDFTDEQGALYLAVSGIDAPVSGFRLDFILYSAVPVFLGYYLIKAVNLESKMYEFMWCVYTITNIVFLLCTYGTFINRIAYLSWLMYPIVILYPFVNMVWSKKQKKYLNYVVYGHLGFTCFMIFIYYGLLSL